MEEEQTPSAGILAQRRGAVKDRAAEMPRHGARRRFAARLDIHVAIGPFQKILRPQAKLLAQLAKLDMALGVVHHIG